MKAPFLLGRLLFGGFFLYNGIHHFQELETLSKYAESKNVPAAKLGVAATGAALTIGGASVLLGIKPKMGTLAIMGFLASVSPLMHDFWHDQDPNQRMNNLVNFSKNMALMGASLALMGVEEPWPASVPVPRENKIDRARRLFRRKVAA